MDLIDSENCMKMIFSFYTSNIIEKIMVILNGFILVQNTFLLFVKFHSIFAFHNLNGLYVKCLINPLLIQNVHACQLQQKSRMWQKQERL